MSPLGGGSTGKRSCDPETLKAIPVACACAGAAGRAEVPLEVSPGAAANDTATTVTGCPGRTIRWGSPIIVVVAVFCPFPNITMNLVETPRVRLECVNRERLLLIFPTRTDAVVVICPPCRNRSAPPIRRGRTGTRHIFSFGFA